jgi:hypothetical protein
LILGTVAVGCGGHALGVHDAGVKDGPARIPDAANDAREDATDAVPPGVADATTNEVTANDAMANDRTTTDAPPSDAIVADATDTKRADAPPAEVGSVDGGVAPGAGSVLVVAGEIELIGSGPDSCSNQLPATSDRWCGFAKKTVLGTYELWVVDVTKVAANVPVTCDATDPSCLRLSRALYSDPTNGFRGTGFDGDTLTYSELPSTGAGIFQGTVSAWRPGWSAGRPITSRTGVVCNGSRASPAELCLENLSNDVAGETTVEFHAGVLDEQASGPLPFVDTILVTAPGDAAGVQKWKASLTPDGARVAWSTRPPGGGMEHLAVQLIGDDSSRLSIANNISQWIVTADSHEWLWLSAYNYDQNAPSGFLQSASFPGGAGIQTLAASVGDFMEAGPKGVLFRTGVTAAGGTLMLAPDRDVPAAVRMLDQGVQFVFEATADGARATYTKNITQPAGSSAFLFDLWLSDASGAAPCALTATPNAFIAPRFLSGGDMTAWGRVNTLTNVLQGVYTKTTDCTSRAFASSIWVIEPVGDEGYVFLDDVAPDPSVNEATLRYAKVANGLLPVQGTTLQMRAGLSFAVLLPTLPAVAYIVTTGGPGDGLYVNATLPFTTTP